MTDTLGVDELFGGVDDVILAPDDDDVASAESNDTRVATNVTLEEDVSSSLVKDNNDDDNDIDHQTSSTIAATTQGPHAPITFANKQTCLFLFDTGANDSIISAHILDDLQLQYKLHPTDKKLSGISGTGLNVLGKVTLSCTLNQSKGNVQFLVIEEPDIAIFGLRAMNEFKVNICAETHTISCNGFSQTYQLTQGQMGRQCQVFVVSTKKECNVRLLQDELIPAKSNKIVLGEIFKDKPQSEFCLVELDYAQNRYDTVLPAHVTRSEDVIPFSIHNILDHPVKLKKGATMGVASPTELNETENTLDLLSDIETEGSPDRHPIDQLSGLDDLTEEQRQDMERICMKYHTVFSRNDLDIGKCTFGPQRLPLKEDSKVVREPPRKYNPEQRAEMKKQCDALLDRGIIEASNSPYRSYPVMAPKKDNEGRWIPYKRMAIDFRNINLQLLDLDSKSRALPRVQDIFDSIATTISGAKDPYFAKLDISSAFHCVEIDERDRDILSFAAPTTLYRFTRLPFGIKSSPSIFQSTMEKALMGLVFLTCFVFLDDIVVIGRDWAEYCKNLEDVLHRLAICGMKIKCDKVLLGKKSISILGFVISNQGVQICPLKQRACSLWKQPLTCKQTLSFVQFCNFVRKHIEQFAEIARPLYDLCNASKFEWTESCERSFQALKKAVISAPALRLPDFTKTVYLASDFCKQSIGYCLLQRENDTKGPWYALLYGSKAMTKSQQASWGSPKGELFGLCHAMSECRPYLHAAKSFCVFTDHKSLTYLAKQKEISAFCLRMLEKVSELRNFRLYHYPGENKRIAIVDRLSRANLEEMSSVQWHEIYGKNDTVSAVTTRNATKLTKSSQGAQPGDVRPSTDDSKADSLDSIPWKERQSKDKDLVLVKSWLKKGHKKLDDVKLASPALRSYFMNFSQLKLIDGIIFRVWTVSASLTRDLIVVPLSMVHDVLFEAHDMSGHCGEAKTLLKARTKYFWFGMTRDIELFVKSCEICMRMQKVRAKAPLQPIFKSFFNEYLFMDIKVLDKYPCRGYTGILILIEGFSKLTVLCPIKSREATELMSHLWTSYITKHGCPLNLVTDREASFVLSSVSKAFYELCSIRKLNSVSNRAKCDGQTEIYVKLTSTIMTAVMLTDKMRGELDVDWVSRLPYVEFAINSTPSSMTQLSPYFIATGRDPFVPLSLTHDIHDDDKSVSVHVRELRRKQLAIFDYVRSQAGVKSDSMKFFYDSKAVHKEPAYTVGQKVLYRDYRGSYLEAKSFHAMYRPEVYTVLKVLGVNYLIAPENDESKSKIVHYNQLREYVDRPTDVSNKLRSKEERSKPLRLGFRDNGDHFVK